MGQVFYIYNWITSQEIKLCMVQEGRAGVNKTDQMLNWVFTSNSYRCYHGYYVYFCYYLLYCCVSEGLGKAQQRADIPSPVKPRGHLQLISISTYYINIKFNTGHTFDELLAHYLSSSEHIRSVGSPESAKLFTSQCAFRDNLA